ncbi:MAG: hypothetical protein ACE5F1_21545, partial [Planctomycetota bacterium]
GPELLEGGDRGIFSLLTIAVGVGDPHGLLSQLLVELGARHPETLLHVRQRINERSRRVLQRMRGTRKCDELLGPVLRRLGPEPMGFFQRLLSQPDTLADRGLRGLIIDYFVGCGDIQAFEGLARRFSPVEIVRHMNRRIPAEELGQLFARMPEESSFLRDAILADPALDRPEAFARALSLCREKDVQRFEKLFEERGADPRLISELVLLLNGPGDANRRAEQVLARFLPTAIDYLVASYADPETPAHALEAIRRLLRGQGADAVGELVRCLGSNPAEVDDRVILALVDLGEGALEEIESSYRQQMGWLGKLGLLHGRHPRSCLIRAVASIPGARAFGVLQRLLTSETDAELRSILREALRQSRGKETE